MRNGSRRLPKGERKAILAKRKANNYRMAEVYGEERETRKTKRAQRKQG